MKKDAISAQIEFNAIVSGMGNWHKYDDIVEVSDLGYVRKIGSHEYLIPVTIASSIGIRHILKEDDNKIVYIDYKDIIRILGLNDLAEKIKNKTLKPDIKKNIMLLRELGKIIQKEEVKRRRKERPKKPRTRKSPEERMKSGPKEKDKNGRFCKSCGIALTGSNWWKCPNCWNKDRQGEWFFPEETYASSILSPG